jgi:hypothetical protein
MVKYEVGQIVKIIDSFNGHRFEDGELVRITEIHYGNYEDEDGVFDEYRAEKLDGSDYWYIYENEDKSEFEAV